MRGSRVKLTGATMSLRDVEDLAPIIREADRLDCVMHGCDPKRALMDAYVAGPAWTARWENRPVGAFGWTYTGFIWSLWTDLTRAQAAAVLQWSPAVIRGIAQQAQRPLYNTVRSDNRLTIEWLKASRCFDFIGEELSYEGNLYLPFFVKPLGDL